MRGEVPVALTAPTPAATFLVATGGAMSITRQKSAIAFEERPAETPEPDAEEPVFETPYLGRTVRIVGPVANVDPATLPHAKAGRGELGKAVFNWRNNTISKDPLARVAYDTHAADPRNH